MHMKIEGKKLARMLDVHKHLVNEIKIKFKKDGVHITSVDAMHIGMVTTILNSGACQEYDIRKTGDLEIGIELKKLRGFLKLGKPNDIFTFDYDVENMKLIVKLGNIVRTMGLVDTEGSPDLKPLGLSMKNKAILDSKTFYDSLKGVMPEKKRKWNNEIYLTISKDSIILENHDSDENLNREKKSVITRDFIHDVIAPVAISNIYDSDMIHKQIKIYKKFVDQIIIGIVEKDQPLCIIGKNQDIEIEFWLAPITEEGAKQDIIFTSESEIKEPVAEPEIKETSEPRVIEPLIAELRYGSVDVVFYEKQWIFSGDFDHVDRADILHNVKILKQIYDKYSEKIKGCFGVCKDYDKDYAYFLSTSKKRIPNILEELKVFDKIKIKEYYKGHIQHGIQWFTFEELEVQTRIGPEVKPEFEIKKAIKEPELPEKTPLEEQISAEKSGVTTEKPRSKAQITREKPTEPVTIVQKTESIEECHKNIGWLASPKNDFYLVGEIIAVTKTGYLILFRGSKKFKEPVEIDRELVEVYRRGD